MNDDTPLPPTPGEIPSGNSPLSCLGILLGVVAFFVTAYFLGLG